MAIPLTGTFEYEGIFSPKNLRPGDYVVHAIDSSDSKGPRLVGHRPRIRFWNQNLVLIAADDDQVNATTRMAIYGFGEVVHHVAEEGDYLHVRCIGIGDIGLSILRAGTLRLAIGAVCHIPLGNAPFSKNFLASLKNREWITQDGYCLYVERTWENGVLDGRNAWQSVWRKIRG